jgi:hypothetical protein
MTSRQMTSRENHVRHQERSRPDGARQGRPERGEQGHPGQGQRDRVLTREIVTLAAVVVLGSIMTVLDRTSNQVTCSNTGFRRSRA